MDVKAQRVSVVRFTDTMLDIHMVMFGSYCMDHLPEVMCDGSGSSGEASWEAMGANDAASHSHRTEASQPNGAGHCVYARSVQRSTNFELMAMNYATTC